jgi:thiol:disulfide interchange protein
MKVDRILPILFSSCIKLSVRLLAFVLVGLVAQSAVAAGPSLSPSVDHVRVDLISPSESVQRGKKAWIGLRMRHDPHWHTYWKSPGDAGLPTQFELTLPGMVKSGPIHWPKPQRIFIPPLANYGYEDEVVLSRELDIPGDFSGDKLDISAKVSWLVCKEVCIPGGATVSLVLPVQANPPLPSVHQALFEKNWSLEPKIELPVQAFASTDKLSLVLPITIREAKRVEFFALSEETIIHSASQPLFKTKEGRYRLELALATEKKTDFSMAPERAAGVLDVDGQFYVVNPSTVGQANTLATESDTLVATLSGAPARLTPNKPSPAEALRLATESQNSSTPIASTDAQPNANQPTTPESAAPGVDASPGLWLSLGAALIGGLILNLMPCVFPVIGLKLMSFAGHGGSGSALTAANRRRLRFETMAFASGVVMSFLALGGVMIFLRSAGQAVGWGFQLQSPWFVGAMVLLFVALALNFAGLFEVGLGLTQLGNLESRNTPLSDSGSGGSHPGQAFLSGVLAVLVATPCTAPFMGSALGFSLAQPASEALLVFGFLGLGMALPYLVLAAFPAWLKRLPKPGRWMESFKQFLAFPMFAAAVWLLWVFGLQTSPEALMQLAMGAVGLAFSLWLYGRFFQGIARLGLTSAAGLSTVALILLGVVAAVSGLIQGAQADPAKAMAKTGSVWQPWSAQAVKAGLAQGRPVFVDFTAAWCVSCQANKKMVLETKAVEQAFASLKTLQLKADWTRQDPLITAELNRHGRSGVPLYLLFMPGQAQPKILPELLTQAQVLSALGLLTR